MNGDTRFNGGEAIRLGAIAHELRAPLTIIRAYARSMLEGRVPLEDASALDLVRRIELSARQAEALIGDIAEVAALQARCARSQREDLALRDFLAEELLPDLGVLAPGRALTLCLPTLEVQVVADAGRIREVLANLVENAHKYSRPGAPITIRLHAGAGSARIEVEDCGPGVAEEELEQVFEAFHRSASTAAFPGSGLGLSLCRIIADAHGGRIWAERASSGAFRVVLSLPLAADVRRPCRLS